MIDLLSLWAILVVAPGTMARPMPDSGFGWLTCDMMKQDKYTNLVGSQILSPPHLVSGSTCTSYVGMRILSA